ncbi:hypothetical protein NST56_06920 [Bacillus sp. FSL R5-0560]|uniref:hypothetical protein n=1 Tax=Bacillus sp. FSL R5-0560 TaxID=2954588 RepID=UPI0030D0C7DA
MDFLNFLVDFLDYSSRILYDQLPPIFRLLIPFTLTIYLFSYKERKEVTYSYLKQKKVSKNALISIVLTVIVLVFLGLHYYSEIRDTWFNNLFVVFCALWAFFIFYTYKELFNSVNIFAVKDRHLKVIKKVNGKIKMYSYIYSSIIYIAEKLYKSIENNIKINFIKNTCKYFLSILFIISKDEIRKKYLKELESLDLAIQILTQILLSKTKYNLSKDVSKALKDVTDELVIFTSYSKDSMFNENLVSLDIIMDVESVYSTILKNIEMLVESSLKNSRTEDLHQLLKVPKNIELPPLIVNETVYQLSLNKRLITKINEDLLNLRRVYIKSIKSLTSILHTNQYMGDLTLVRNIINLPNEGNENTTGLPSSEAIFTLQVSIIIESIMKNNIKLLTDIVNITLENNHNKKIESSVLNIFVLCAIKAIEQGHYKCAGHLVKMIVKNADIEDIKTSTSEIIRHFNGVEFHSEDEFLNLFRKDIDSKLADEFMLSLPFSKISFDYCFSKFIFLLEQQYNFIKKVENNDLFDSFKFATPKDYIKNKVNGLHKEYGLIILREDIMTQEQEVQMV